MTCMHAYKHAYTHTVHTDLRQKMLRPWSQQARQLTLRRRTVAHLGNWGCCVHIHTGNLSPYIDEYLERWIDICTYRHICIYSCATQLLTSTSDPVQSWPVRSWPLHNIAVTNSVWCMAYKGGVGWGAYIAQKLCNSITMG